jgi:signal peptidase II
MTFLVFAADLCIKKLAVLYLAPDQTYPLIKNILHLTYVQNTGVAFGLFKDQRPWLIFIGVIICATVVYFYARSDKCEAFFRACLAIVLGGSLGNLYDRIFYGYVIDYIDFRVFPVFNFADIAINIGVFLILFSLLFREPECTR